MNTLVALACCLFAVVHVAHAQFTVITPVASRESQTLASSQQQVLPYASTVSGAQLRGGSNCLAYPRGLVATAYAGSDVNIGLSVAGSSNGICIVYIYNSASNEQQSQRQPLATLMTQDNCLASGSTSLNVVLPDAECSDCVLRVVARVSTMDGAYNYYDSCMDISSVSRSSQNSMSVSQGAANQIQARSTPSAENMNAMMTPNSMPSSNSGAASLNGVLMPNSMPNSSAASLDASVMANSMPSSNSNMASSNGMQTTLANMVDSTGSIDMTRTDSNAAASMAQPSPFAGSNAMQVQAVPAAPAAPSCSENSYACTADGSTLLQCQSGTWKSSAVPAGVRCTIVGGKAALSRIA